MVDPNGVNLMEGFAPVASPAAPSAPPEGTAALLGYASGKYPRVGQSRWGKASFILSGITVLYCVVCVIAMFNAKGWDSLAWLVFGFLGNWIGCGIAAALALVGVLQRRRGRRLAAHALWVSLVLGIGPIGIGWLATALR